MPRMAGSPDPPSRVRHSSLMHPSHDIIGRGRENMETMRPQGTPKCSNVQPLPERHLPAIFVMCVKGHFPGPWLNMPHIMDSLIVAFKPY